MAHVSLRTGFSATIKNFPMSQTFSPWFLAGTHTLEAFFFFFWLTLDGNALGRGLLLF